MKPLILLFALTAALSLHGADSIYDVPLKDIDGKAVTLKPHKGQALLIVNVASQCGYTSQYEGLEALHRKYKTKGLTVLGFPCNQFGGQEPGSNKKIKEFCSSNYNVTFPMFEKIKVNGPDRHPLFAKLLGKKSAKSGNIRWNFEKILVGRDGKVLQRFTSGDEPGSPEVEGAVRKALAAK